MTTLIKEAKTPRFLVIERVNGDGLFTVESYETPRPDVMYLLNEYRTPDRKKAGATFNRYLKHCSATYGVL